MNDKNQKLLFSDSDEETVVITLTDEDGQDIDAEIMAGYLRLKNSVKSM